ncbi:MAG: PEP-CTERM sorting domain-containing protein [Anaerolineae bacterium]|nr:PEP-CTERM sorting domain-containing protein [Anaerolineae bacterium]
MEFVPEPGSILLLGSGLAGLAGYASLRWRARE